MKILITGGHIAPALAVIEELKGNSDIVFVGRKYTFEGDRAESFDYNVCKENDIPFYSITTGRFQRRFTRHTIPSLIKFPIGIVNSLILIFRLKPDIILTFGGFLGLPISIAGFMLGVPIVVHEQTQRAGISSRIIAKFAKKVCISFESSSKYFPRHKTILTGNPVRKEIFEIKEKIEIPEACKTILVMGGSSGSHFINEIICKISPKLLEKYVLIHQTGDTKEYQDFENIQRFKENLSKKLSERYVLRKFIFPSEIGWVYKKADIIVSRSGINTVSEIIALQKMCLLIPLPHGQQNEQLENALLIEKLGLGNFIEQKNISEVVLLEAMEKMLENNNNYVIKKELAEKYIFSDASQRLINVLQLIYGQNREKKTPKG